MGTFYKKIHIDTSHYKNFWLVHMFLPFIISDVLVIWRLHLSVSLDDLMERYITDDALTETTAARQKLRRVQALLQQKDERTRSVVYLRAQGYSYQEIAQKLQITEASARVVEHRTRAWLKATLQKEGYDE